MLGRLKSTVYARMEEMSFRSGAAVTGGVLAAAGAAITLTVLLGGHIDAATTAPSPDAAARSMAPPSSVALPYTAPAAAPPFASPSVTPRVSRTTGPATVAGAYQPHARVRASATPRAAATPVPGRTTRWHRRHPLWSPGDRRPGQPGYWGWPGNRPEPWPWGLSRHHHRR